MDNLKKNVQQCKNNLFRSMIMKKIIVLGAGQSTPYLISYLLGEGEKHDWFVVLADRDFDQAIRRIGDHPRGEAIHFDINDSELRSTQIEQADLVVNMMAPRFQPLIAWDCVNHGKSMVSVSYRDKTIRDLEMDAQRKGILLLTEIGLDPGIDHMSAMSLIHDLKCRGGIIKSFISYGSGVPAPDSITNPLKYVITWNPRNVVMSGEAGAQYLIENQIKIVPWHHLFQHSWPVEVHGLGRMEAYPNRDSLSYKAIFHLEHVETMVRGTLRYPGWSETWHQIVRLGMPNEALRIPDLPKRSFRELVEMFIPRNVAGMNLEERVASYLRISPTGKIMENLAWLGLFSPEPCGAEGETAAEALIHLLKTKLPLEPGKRDMVVLVHELEVEYPEKDKPRERITSTFIHKGEAGGFTAMAKSVGLPAGIAVKLILNGDIPITGCHLPTHPAVYQPILAELAQQGFTFSEKSKRAQTKAAKM